MVPLTTLPIITAMWFLGRGICVILKAVTLEGSKSAASPDWVKPLRGVLAVALPCGLGTFLC